MKQILLLACFSGRSICDLIYKNLNTIYEHVEYEKITDDFFSSKETKIIVNSEIRNKDVYIVQDVTNFSDGRTLNDNIFSVLLLSNLLKNYGANSINLILPYIPYARQDRISIDIKEPLSGGVFLTLLDNAGFDHIITCDIHNSTLLCSLRNSKLINIDTYDIFLKEYISKFNFENYLIASTDFGGTKKLLQYSQKFDFKYIHVGKFRDKNKKIRNSFSFENIENKNILLLDDMIDTGNTMLNIVENFHLQNCNKISIFSTHALFSSNSFYNFETLINQKKLDLLYLTNTTTNALNLCEKYSFIKLIDITKDITNMIKEIQS